MLATAHATNSCFKYLSSKDKSIYILTLTNENLIWHSAKYIYNAMELRSALLSPPVQLLLIYIYNSPFDNSPLLG